MKLITTSWDDGHPNDFKVAELLDKYNLSGTFYIPRNNSEHEVMSEGGICTLSKHFEIGGHTLNHIRLRALSRGLVEAEVKGCFYWLKGLLGVTPVSFCFPGGVFDRTALNSVQNAGFRVIRTVELLSPSLFSDRYLMPTTLQVYNHTRLTYLVHTLKRFSINNLLMWLSTGGSSKFLHLIDHYLDYIMRNDGCFHLWGHSWEIEEMNLWDTLETLFKHLAYRQKFTYVSNGETLNFHR